MIRKPHNLTPLLLPNTPIIGPSLSKIPKGFKKKS